MPTPQPKPNQPNEQRVASTIAKLKERGALKTDLCPQCNVFSWNVDFIALLTQKTQQDANNPTSTVVSFGPDPTAQPYYVPMISLACTNCGYTIMFNLKLLGLARGE